MELYIIRHGETDWNKEKRLQGRSDTELNEYGIELAEITGEALKDVHFDCIYSSPLKRAVKTAQIIKRDRDLEIITDDRLREISFGVVEGVPMSERPEGFQKFFTDPANYVAPEGGESYEELVKRTGEFIEDVVVPASKTMERMLIVAHGALNKALMLNLTHDEIKNFWEGIFQRNCCVNIFDIQGKDFKLLQNGVIFYEEQEGKRYK
jgi:probable phosphoglycerate mutase